MWWLICLHHKTEAIDPLGTNPAQGDSCLEACLLPWWSYDGPKIVHSPFILQCCMRYTVPICHEYVIYFSVNISVCINILALFVLLNFGLYITSSFYIWCYFSSHESHNTDILTIIYQMPFLLSWLPQYRHTYHDLSDATSPLLTPTIQTYLPWSIRCHFSSPDSHNTDILTMIYQMPFLLSCVPQYRHTYHDLSDATSPILTPTTQTYLPLSIRCYFSSPESLNIDILTIILSDAISPLLSPTTLTYLPLSIRCHFSSPDSHNTDILTMIYQMLFLLSWVPQHRHTYHDLSDANSPLLSPTTQTYLPWSIRCYFSYPESHNTDILTMIFQMLLLLSCVPQNHTLCIYLGIKLIKMDTNDTFSTLLS